MDEQRLYDILKQDVEVPDMVNKKLENTYAQLEGKERPAKRWGPRSLRTVLIAAALTVGCVLCVAAGLPAQMYNFVSGGTTTVLPGTGEAHFVIDGESPGPITEINGRLWFEADGQKVDVTGLMDENTPYIHERTDPATGNKGYVILGGTVDNFGWAEFFLAENNGTCSMVGENAFDYLVPMDGQEIPLSELTDAQRDMLNADGGISMRTINRPWLDAALAQLDLEGHFVG